MDICKLDQPRGRCMGDHRSNQSPLSSGFVPLDHADRAGTAKTKALYAYWQRLQAAGRPTRASLDPLEMKPYLANLVTGDIEPDPFRVHYQLVGTVIATYSRLDFTIATWMNSPTPAATASTGRCAIATSTPPRRRSSAPAP